MSLNNSSKKQFVSTILFSKLWSVYFTKSMVDEDYIRQKNLKRNRLQQQPFNKKLTAF